jgi:hypothetical protein
MSILRSKHSSLLCLILYDKPLQPVAGEELATPIKIDISAILPTVCPQTEALCIGDSALGGPDVERRVA